MQNTPIEHAGLTVPAQANGDIDAVICHRSVLQPNGTYIHFFTPIKVNAQFVESRQGFQQVPLSSQLGVPLGSIRMAVLYYEEPATEASLAQAVHNDIQVQNANVINIFANFMHLSIDTSDPDKFSHLTGSVFEREVMFMRLDHGPLDHLQMHALSEFCIANKGLISTYRDNVASKTTRDAKVAYAKEIMAAYTPRAFADFFADFRLRSIALGDVAYVDAECPVLAFCAACLKDGGQGVLKQCAKCRRRMYCGRECQKRDWARHKKHCKQAEGEEAAGQAST